MCGAHMVISSACRSISVADDGLSLSFTSSPLAEPAEILGFPEVCLKISVDQPNALLAVRLCDVAPTGDSRLVSWGLLNLTHRDDHLIPEPLIPGKEYDVTVRLNVTAHRLNAGHRWRLAISPTYWPHAWPSPVAVKLTLHTGAASRLILPLRTPNALDESLRPFGIPEGAPMLLHDELRMPDASRSLTYDVTSGRLQMVDRIDDGRNRLLDGLIYDSLIINTFTIQDKEPNSANVRCDRQIEISRGDWATRIETSSIMSSDKDYFHLTNILDAYEGPVRVFTKSWTRKIRRELV